MKKRVVFKKYLKTIKDYNRIAKVGEIARRYLAMNTFDGVLTILGILVASFIAGFNDYKIIITTSFAAAVAIGISGFYGAYLTEKAERAGDIKNLEKNMSIWLKGTQIEKAHKLATLELALIDGVSPLIASAIIISPFLLKIPVISAYYTSFVISFSLLFLLGIFLGKVSKENIILSGIKMILIGAVCTVILYFLNS